MPTTPEEKADQAEKAFDSALETIQNEAKRYQEFAHVQGFRYSLAKTATVVLSVLTPTLVTFQMQHSAPEEFQVAIRIGTVALTSLAGIVAGLQAAFRWGEGYARWTGTGLDLA